MAQSPFFSNFFAGNDTPYNNSNTLLSVGLGLLSGKTANEQVGNAASNFANERQMGKTFNKTIELLKKENPQLAQAVAAGVMSPLDAYKSHVAAQGPKKPIEINGRLVDPNTYEVLADFSTKPKEDRQSLVNAGDGRIYDPNSKEWVTAPGANSSGGGFKADLDTMKTYRGEDDVKSYRDVRNSYERVRSAAQLGNAQGDIGLVYGYMKMLDPGSVVREGEFATAQNSGGIDTTIVNMYNKILNGERLTPEQRQQFASAAEGLYQQSAANLSDTNKQYQGFADQYGVPADRFMVQPEKYEPLKLGQSTSLTVGGKPATITRVGD